MPHNGYSLLVSDGHDSKSTMIRGHVEKVRRHVWMRFVCKCAVLVGMAALIAFVGFRPDLMPSDGSMQNVLATEVPNYRLREAKNRSTMYIEDVIDMDSDVLVLIRKPPSSAFPVNESMECRYGDASRKATAVHLVNDRLAVLCPAPPETFRWDKNFMVVAVGQAVIHPKVTVPRRPWQWYRFKKVVYEAFPTETDVVVFVRGFNASRQADLSAEEEDARLKGFQCVYGGHFETDVTAAAQEVIRCAHPPVDSVRELAGKSVSVKFQGRILPSVAHYNPGLHLPENTGSSAAPLKHRVCSCTMVYNVARFLKEWVIYNHHLGVEKFFLYDNNSEDDLDATIATLRMGGFDIQKLAWPWVKTQEAGFSHCALLAQNECQWMLFTDVDEFVVPSHSLLGNGSQDPDEAGVSGGSSSPPARFTSVTPPPTRIFPGFANSSILDSLIKAATTESGQVGQVSMLCRNFGPSGLTATPPQGVTQGYTCRLKHTERHKSIVLLSSIKNSLANKIHHFSLKPGFQTKTMQPQSAVINHYKFQAWDEFKNKFRRRAATYVADWTENRGHGSKDRLPDLGTKPIKPADWESRYCEVHDYGLKNHIQRVFGSYDRDNTLHLPWE